MEMKPMREYQNGNCFVRLFPDGTKTRTYEGKPKPKFPESVDLKVTDRCDVKCGYCHECSTPTGDCAAAGEVEALCWGLPAGAELAIGGGDPLTWRPLANTLWELRSRGFIPNLTVNAKSKYVRDIYFKSLIPLVYGLGWSGDWNMLDILQIPDDKVVHHLIAGVDAPKEACNKSPRTLILGYKQYGRGKNFYNPNIEKNLNHWRYKLPAILGQDKVVAFDNLALEQLRVKEVVEAETWHKHYMGDDGVFTMYVDAVKKEYAASSTAPRKPLGDMSIAEAFEALQKEREHEED